MRNVKLNNRNARKEKMSNNNSTNYTNDEYQLNAIGGRKCLKGRRSLKRQQQQQEQQKLLFCCQVLKQKSEQLNFTYFTTQIESECIL